MTLPPEFIVPRDDAEKQDCERNAAKRWLVRQGAAVAHLRPIYLGDDLCACQPIVEVIQKIGGSFILTCKPSSHQTVTEYLYVAKLQEHRQASFERGKRTTTVYRWLSGVPLRGTADAIAVTWFAIKVFNDKAKRTYHNSFGHGQKTLASPFVTLNLLAFAFHTAARLEVLAWKQTMATTGATCRFFEHPRVVTTYVVFQTWDHLLRSIAQAAIRPP